MTGSNVSQVDGASTPTIRGMRRPERLLFSKYSIEATPKEVLSNVSGLSALPKGTRTFLTWLPKTSFENTVAAAARLQAMGLVPVPHVAARMVPDSATLARHLEALVGTADVREILLVAGSADAASGRFESALDVLDSGVIESSGLTALSVAGHPEGHPNADDAELCRALDRKNEFAARTGLPTGIVTQFFFDAAPVITWERRMRQRGNVLPIDPGIHGVTDFARLTKYAIACGVGASAKALSRRSGGILDIVKAHMPDGIVDQIAAAMADDPANLFRSCHLFPLGGLSRTIPWANARREADAQRAVEG